MKSEKAKRIFKIIGIVLAVAAVFVLTAWAMPYILQLRDPQKRQAFADFLSSLGPWGIILLFLLQFLQIIIAVIPGEPIEIIGGVICGTLGGLLLCLAGIALGSTCVFLLVKRFGMRFVNKFVNSKAFDKLKFLHNPTKRDIFLFILFFIPVPQKIF